MLLHGAVLHGLYIWLNIDRLQPVVLLARHQAATLIKDIQVVCTVIVDVKKLAISEAYPCTASCAARIHVAEAEKSITGIAARFSRPGDVFICRGA